MADARNDSKKVFFSGVLSLSVSTFLIKIIGLIYKIPMLSYLGSEGMGYFNSAYEIYAFFCVIATAGLPIALSVLISGASAKGEAARIDRIYRVAFRLFVGIGLIGCAAIWLLARPLCIWLQSDGAYASILTIAPAILFVCISSAIRGYFQGLQQMLPTAVSQLIEAAGKLVFGLIFASMALRLGNTTETVSAAAGLGITVGSTLSTAYLIWIKKRNAGKHTRTEPSADHAEKGYGLRPLLSLALPMTVSAILTSITKMIDMSMILRGLQSIGYSELDANAAYGSYTTLAISVFSLLPTLLNSVALPLIPILSAAIASKDTWRQHQLIETSYRLTSFFAVPASLGIAVFAAPVLSLIFNGQEGSIRIAAPLLSLLGGSVFLSCMITATNSVLHAYRSVKLPILALVAGVVVKLIASYVLIGNPKIGLIGAPISSFLCNATIVFLNFCFASAYSNKLSVRKLFFVPLINGVASVGFSYLCYLHFSESRGDSSLVTLTALFGAMSLYFLLSALSGGISVKELRAVPCLDTVFRRLERQKARFFKENKQKTGK